MGGHGEARRAFGAEKPTIIQIPADEPQRVRSAVRSLIGEQFPELATACIGFYWPIKGEIDPAYLGYLSEPEIRNLLTALLARGRTAVRAIDAVERARNPARNDVLRDLARAELQIVTILSRHAARLPSATAETEPPAEAVIEPDAGLPDFARQLKEGHAWAEGQLHSVLPRIGDPELHRDLTTLAAIHAHNAS